MFVSIKKHFETNALSSIKIPIIVKAELLYGIENSKRREENRASFENFMKAFEVTNLNDQALYHYAKIRSDLETAGKIIGANDLYIASIALAHNGTLVTHNTNEFKRINELTIEDWTESL
jgi:tRNA(fMet)-specific endonuclease VapC